MNSTAVPFTYTPAEQFGYEHIDTEYAVTTSGNVRFLQARPVVAVLDELYVVEEDSVRECDIIMRGAYSLLGACTGKVKMIEDFNALSAGSITIEPEDIVVAVKVRH